MACTLQVQYCNPNLPEEKKCEPLRGRVDAKGAEEELNKIFGTERYKELLEVVESKWLPLAISPDSMVMYVGAAALRARYALAYGYSGGLPDKQWQIEAEHWTKGMLASLQDAFVTTVGGLPEEVEIFRVPPAANETVARGMCRNQKIMSTDYTSFSVLGISLILVFGCCIIVLDMGLQPALAWWQRRQFNKHQRISASKEDNGEVRPLYKSVEWSQMGTLQLQRLAHEEAGFGTWSRCHGDTPVTEPGQQLATLDLYDVERPALKSPVPRHAGPANAKSRTR